MQLNGHALPICFATNRNYMQHFLVSLISLLEKNEGSHEVFILNTDLTEGDLLLIQTLSKKVSPATKIHSLIVDTAQLPNLKGHETRLGTAALLRLALPDLLPKSYQFAFYLDADIVINQKIEFGNIPLHDYTIFAVLDPSSHLFAPKRGIEKMFNSGVLLFNLHRWREEKILEKLSVYNPPIARLADQELLNGVFDKKWFELPKALNANAIYLSKVKGEYSIDNGIKPQIIHFMGMSKPWLYWTPGNMLYWRYVWKTPNRWQILRILMTIANRLMYSVINRIRTIRKSFKK
jgi:lipopolysaccharide biosynthesis glycosyltransferase